MARYPRLGVTEGLRGFFALLYDEEGAINTADTSYKEAGPAWLDARVWAEAEGLECDDQPIDPLPPSSKKKKAPVVLKALDDTKGRGICKSDNCQARIWWYQLVSGKRHPFDAQPDGSPPVYVQTEHTEDRRLVGHIDSAVSHFATCPESKGWKGKGSK